MTIAANTSRNKRAEPPADLLVGERTVMRPVAEQDLSALQAWDDDPEIIALMGQKYDDISVHDWFHSLRNERNCRALVIETKEGRLIGELELAQMNWRSGTAEVRICIGEKDCWDKGYGTDAIQTALRLSFEGYGLRQIYLRVFATNVRAVRVYQRVGFRKEALLQPSERRKDPSPVILMTITRERWGIRRATSA